MAFARAFAIYLLERILPGSTQRASYKDLYKITHGPLRGLQQGLHKILRQGPTQVHARKPGGFHQGLFKIFSQGPLQDQARTSDKDLYHIMQGPLSEHFARISRRSSYHDLCKITQGARRQCLQDLHKTCTG